jgi:hypothetical protein
MKLHELRKDFYLSIRTLLKAGADFLLALSFLVCGASQAQDEGAKPASIRYLGFHFDAGLHSFREDLLVPLGFNGPGASLGGIYTRQKDNTYFNIRLKLGLAYLKNRYSHEAGLATLELRPTWLWKLGHRDGTGGFWGGICVPLQINSDLGLHSWDDSHLYWLTTYSIGPAVEWWKSVSQKSTAVVRLETPLIGWVSRPPTYRYNKQDALNHFTFQFSEPNRALHFETVDAYRAVFIQILLRHELRRSLFSYGLEFQYNYCNIPKNVYILNTSMTVSYQWRIGR